MSVPDKNTIAVVITCEKHQNVALTTLKNPYIKPPNEIITGIWLPNAPNIESESWDSNADIVIRITLTDSNVKLGSFIGAAYTRPKFVYWQRLGRPNGGDWTECMIFSTKLVKNEIKTADTHWTCCTNSIVCKWHSIQDVLSGHVGLPLAGREVIDILRDPDPYGIELVEFNIRKATEFTPKDYGTAYHKATPNEELLKSANYKVAEVTHIYGEYLSCCYPSVYMNPITFGYLMGRLAIPMTNEVLAATYNAIRGQDTFLTFHKLIVGLAALDEHTVHGGNPAAIRSKFIFRYYDVDEDGILNDPELTRMTTDIVLNDGDIPVNKRQAEITMRVKRIKDFAKAPINIETFQRAVSGKHYRGTSSLFKSGKALSTTLHVEIAKKSDKADSMYGIRRRGEGICLACRPKENEISPFVVTLDGNGRHVKAEHVSTLDMELLTIDPKSAATKHEVEHLHNPNFIANEILQSLREFDASTFKASNFPMPATFKRTAYKSSDEFGWMKEDPRKAYMKIKQLCETVSPLFSSDTRIQKVQSPVYVLGDIHGNFKDLMTYEKNLWTHAPAVVPQSFLFLGDYVDRGRWSVEVACYLFAMKLLCPHRFFMCRGNHEIEAIQATYSFPDECLRKYGSDFGPKICTVINNVFNLLPIGALIDESIYCAHGGIPTSDLSINVLQKKIPNNLPDPQNESNSAWEMMWNDPATDDEVADAQREGIVGTNGYIHNSKRNTAYLFTEQALNNFLNINKLQRVLRGHEVKDLGFEYHFNGKLLTVFSSSNYAKSNRAACILVDAGKIRVVTVIT